MSQPTDTPITLPRWRGQRRTAIIGLASLTAIMIALPSSAPWAGVGAVIFLILGLWGWSSPPVTTDAPEHREPSLWDDGFGAN